ncbi:MAG: hypothetical protein EOO28_29340 [Comamonadaceae bacterium]|nr:MAG: hypothetical protein EOO28_29340 [Comamonadaceae bacterium]
MQATRAFRPVTFHLGQQAGTLKFTQTASRTFSGFQPPPREVVRSASWRKHEPDPNQLRFLDAFKRRQQQGDTFRPTIDEVRATADMLKDECHRNDRLERSVTFSSLYLDIQDLQQQAAAGQPGWEEKLPALFAGLTEVIETRADSLMTLRQSWTAMTRTEPIADAAGPPVATFELANGRSASLETVRESDPAALADFFKALPDARFAARYPNVEAHLEVPLKDEPPGRQREASAVLRERLASDAVLNALHFDPALRRPAFLLRDDRQRILGMADYLHRPEAMMQLTHDAMAADETRPGLEPGVPTAELNVVLADDPSVKGQGLAARMLHIAMLNARNAGFGRIVAVIADSNGAMLRALRPLNPSAPYPVREPGYHLYVLDAEGLLQA